MSPEREAEDPGPGRRSQPRGRTGLGQRLLLLNLLVLLLVVSLVVLSQSASRRNFTERASVAAENLAATLAQGVEAEIERVDIGLRNLVVDLEGEAGLHALPAAKIDALLEQQIALLPQLDGLRIADARGLVRHGRGVAEAGRVEIADREHFILSRDGLAAGPVVVGPIQSRVSQRWVVVVARPLRRAGGAFDGVVYANIRVGHFARLLQGVDLGRHGAIAVRGKDLAVVARRSSRGDEPAAVDSRSVSPEFARAHAAQPASGVFTARAMLDGIERANAYRRAGPYPLLVVVGLATADFLVPWRVQTLEVTALAALVLVALGVGSTLLYRAWSGEARASRAWIREGERYRALLRSASDGMHVIDRAGRLVELSDSFAAMLGYRREELLTQHVSFWDALLSSEEVDRRLAAFEMGAGERFSSRHRRRDGSIIDVEVVSVGVCIDGEELLYCSSRDVTERKAQARELDQYRHQLERLVAERTEQWRASEVRFRALVEQSLVGVFVQVRNQLRFVNPGFAAMFGYDSPEAMIGRVPAHTVVAPEDRERVSDIGRRIVSGQDRITKLSFTGLRRDGSRVAIEAYGCPIEDEGGPAAIGLLLDVTAQRQAESERAAALLREQGLRSAAEQQARSLGELLEQREEFVRVLAHEVRQPLNNASAALQSAAAGLISDGGGDHGGAAQRIARAQSVIGQIVASLDNTLASTSLLASTRQIDARDADVGALIDLSLGDLDAAQRPRVRVERISSTRTASMDIGLMRLALRNVLGNALAYSHAGSEVILRVTDSDEPLALVFQVADLGPGIAGELMPRLFERGARGAHGLPGHGIGLNVVRRVMELHGGSVDVLPNQPRGTVFRLWLPQGQ
jgi:PAS domain S-box-containing protein